MKTRLVVCLVAGLAVQVLPIAGADDARVVSLEECLRLGLASDPGLRVERLESAVAQARLRELRGQYVPSVSLQAGYSRLSEVEPGTMTINTGMPVEVSFPESLQNSTSIKLSLQQPLFTGLRISSSIRQAEALSAAAIGDVEKSRRDLRYAIEEAFWQVAKAKGQYQSVQESIAEMESHLADVKKLFDQGMATNNDVLQARMRLEDTRIDLARTAGARDLAGVRLAQLTGLPWDRAIDVSPDARPGVQDSPEAPDVLVARALSSRSEIRSARSRVVAQEAGLDLARAGRYPSVSLVGDYTLADPNPRVNPQSDQFVGSWSIGIFASIDLGRYPQVLAQEDQARDRVTQARENQRRLADAVTAEVVRASLELKVALQTYASLREETAQAEENNRVMKERFRLGVALPSASLDAEILHSRARLREQAALFDCMIAKAGLQRAVGE